MTAIEQQTFLIAGHEMKSCVPYAPSVEEARNNAVLMSAALIFEGNHTDFILPKVSSEDVLFADNRYALAVKRVDAFGEHLNTEKDLRLDVWDTLGIEREQLEAELGKMTIRLSSNIKDPEMLKPTILAQLMQEKNAARFIVSRLLQR